MSLGRVVGAILFQWNCLQARFFSIRDLCLVVGSRSSHHLLVNVIVLLGQQSTMPGMRLPRVLEQRYPILALLPS